MFRSLWLRPLSHRWFGPRWPSASTSRATPAARRRLRPCLEILEDRRVPATFTLDPGNVGELVADIKTANSNGQANVIYLFNGSTYDLTKIDNYWYGPNGLPPITSNLTIHGNGAIIQRAPASGTSDFRLFYVSGGMELAAGSLTMDNVTLKNGIAKGGDSSLGGGGLGAGGAIFNQGTLNLTAVTLADNEALGGSSGVTSAGDGGGGMGQNAPKDDSQGGGFGGSVGNYGGTGGAGSFDSGGGGGGFLVGANGSDATPQNQGVPGSPGQGGGLGGFSTFVADGGTGGRGAAGDLVGGDGGNFGSGGGMTSGGGKFSGDQADAGGGGGGVGGGGSASQNVGEFGGYGGGDGGFGGGGGGGPFGGGGGNGGFGAGGGGNSGTQTTGGPGSGGFGGGVGSSSSGGGGAGMGGAIFNMGADSAHPGSGTATLINCTLTTNNADGGSPFAGNRAGQGFGGALFNLDGSVTLTNDTVFANYVDSGNGHDIYNLAYGNDIDSGAPVKASLVLNNNILASPGGGSISDLVSLVQPGKDDTATVSGSHNLVMRSAGTINPGVITQTADPKLGPLQYNGGLTQTMKPQTGSPVLGGADRSVAPTTDQRGVSRHLFGPLKEPVDLGSVQVSGDIALPPNSPLAPPSLSSPPLHTPPLLGFFDSLLAGVETVNGNGTETMVDSIFGFPLLISTYDGAGNLMSATLFGIDVTFLFELL